MADKRNLRFAIDTGGTFTDIVVLDEAAGTFEMDKSPTTPANTLNGVLNVIDKAELDLKSVGRFFVHGSTTALNALLERKGVKTAYVTTKGFRDVPEIGRFGRPEMYNPKYHKPPQIVPRELRFEVTERLNASGAVLTKLDEEDVRGVARLCRKKEVLAVAVCLLHSFKNPAHERQVKALIQEEYPGVAVAISSDVVTEHREYERSTTTILNAYLAPVVDTWVGELEAELKRRGFTGQLVLTRSDGGGMTGETAKHSPINTLLSGPSGGVIGGLYLAETSEYQNLITMDVGGTSLDVCLIKEGRARTEQETKVSGYPMLIPNLDIRTIGAGGGSIAWIDVAGALHVGPQSAGASPGPICYGQGGTEPTTTDACVVNGYIDPAGFLGGEMSLDVDRARTGIEQKVAAPLGMAVNEGARGMLRIALSNMTEAIKDIAAEQGDDPREFNLLCFGGGGALFGSALMNELEMPAAIVPVAPANFSAWGMLMVDLRHDFSSTLMKKLDEAPAIELNAAFEALRAKGTAVLDEEKVEDGNRKFHRSLDVRYVGQEHTVVVPIEFDLDDDSKARVYEAFNGVYNEVYGYTMDQPAEIVTLRLMAIGEIPTPTLSRMAAGGPDPSAARKSDRSVYDILYGGWIEHAVYDRSRLTAGAVVAGPALIEEATTVTVVGRDHGCRVDGLGNLIISRN